MKNKLALYFLILAIISLLIGILFGLLASLQYIYPEFLKESAPFNKLRPFHVTSVISWIILCATGSIYFFISYMEKLKMYSVTLVKIHFGIFFITGILIYLSYSLGYMEGREYFAFMPIIMIPVILGWFLFAINYFKTVRKQVSNWPVYYWMWGTGIVFMIFHLCEAHLWIFDSVRSQFLKDMTVQWKSNGSFVGSWNMLVYGISIYVMSKINKDLDLARSKVVFFFYFLGLANLMFGWAHHTYILPIQPWIRYVAYGISMTEWIVLAYIIYNWKKSLQHKKEKNQLMATRFLVAADFWIFLNLILALVFSIPAINFFTHGTHVTVAHSMGATIGINTTILLSALLFIISEVNTKFNTSQFWIKRGLQVFNISLFFFWCSLLIAGIKKSYWMYVTKDVIFSEMHDAMAVVYIAIFVFGLGLAISLVMITFPLLNGLLATLKDLNTSSSITK